MDCVDILTPSQWSKDYFTKDLAEHRLGCDIIITTRRLTVVTLIDAWEQLPAVIPAKPA